MRTRGEVRRPRWGNLVPRQGPAPHRAPQRALVLAAVAAATLLAACGGGSSDTGTNSTVVTPNTKVYRMPSASMAPTLRLGQHITVDLLAYRSRAPRVGDVVAVHPPAGAENQRCVRTEPPGPDPSGTAIRLCALASGGPASVVFIKRIVGGPGDRIALRDGRVLRNGVPARERSLTPCERHIPICTSRSAVRVPAGSYYVLGDNRGQSDDSRFWGPVARAGMIGPVTGLPSR